MICYDALGHEVQVGDSILWSSMEHANVFHEGPYEVLKITPTGRVTILLPGKHRVSVPHSERIIKVRVPDGRPMETDVFLVQALEKIEDHYDLRDALKAWTEGAWDEAVGYLEDEE